MGTASENLADLALLTQKDLGRFKWTEIASELQSYSFLRRIMKKEKMKITSGPSIQRRIMVSTSGQAKNTKMFAEDDVQVFNNWQDINVDWRHTTGAFAIERRELAMNRSPAKILDLVKMRRFDALIDQAALWENNGWGSPASSSDDVTPFGLPFWIQKKGTGASDTASTGEFGGGNPSGFSSGAGGLSSTTIPAWANWTHEYTNITVDDLLDKIKLAMYKTDWESPVTVTSDRPQDPRRVLYMNYATRAGIERLAEKQNDQLGSDVDSKNGVVTFQRLPIERVPKLDADTQSPVYGVDWNSMIPFFLKGEFMNEQPLSKAPNQHTVLNSFIDTTWNLVCTNRRKQFVIIKA